MRAYRFSYHIAKKMSDAIFVRKLDINAFFFFVIFTKCYYKNHYTSRFIVDGSPSTVVNDANEGHPLTR